MFKLFRKLFSLFSSLFTAEAPGVDALLEALAAEDPGGHGVGVHGAERGDGALGDLLRAALGLRGPRLAAVHLSTRELAREEPR